MVSLIVSTALACVVVVAFFVSEQTRRRVKQPPSPREVTWRTLPVALIVAGGLVFATATPPLAAPFRLAGDLTMTGALVMLVYAYVLLFKNGFFSFDSRRFGNATPVTKGPYRVFRHPVYAAYAWFILGGSFAYRVVVLPFAVAVFAYGWRQGRREERIFGATYDVSATDRVFPFDRFFD